MRMIVAVDSRWGIGKDNDLLISIPEDMQYYRQTTRGKVVVMGYRTLLSLPGSKPQPGRLNIVLADIEGLKVSGAVVCRSMEQLLRLIGCFDSGDVFVIGGGSIYRQLTPYCEAAHITKMRFDGEADTFITNLDGLMQWSVDNETDIRDYGGIKYSFAEYRNSSPEPIEYAAELSSDMSVYFRKKADLELDLPAGGHCPEELRDKITAYFRPLRDGFGADGVDEFFESGVPSFERYLRDIGAIASADDVKACAETCAGSDTARAVVTKENYESIIKL